MIYLDTKFFANFIELFEAYKTIHLLPLKQKIELQHKIDATIGQCRGILDDAVADEKKQARKKALFIVPESSLFDSNMMHLEDFREEI